MVFRQQEQEKQHEKKSAPVVSNALASSFLLLYDDLQLAEAERLRLDS
jgi:hypothetical protein